MVRPLTLMRNRDRFTYHQSSNIFYTGPQSHYTQRKLGPKVPEWLRKSHGKSKPKGDMDEETSAEGKERNKRKALQSFAKEFGRAVRQQRTRGKTKERTDTLALALSMLKEVQGRDKRLHFININIVDQFHGRRKMFGCKSLFGNKTSVTHTDRTLIN